MIRCGMPPFLECSSRGDKRFSAFYARLEAYDNQTIESIYQAAKVFEGGVTGLSIKQAKGKACINHKEVSALYRQLWTTYFQENPELLKVIHEYRGFSDMFGQMGHVCQATEVYRIWVQMMLSGTKRAMEEYSHLIANVRSDPYDVYCGRGSEWGNVYTHIKDLPGTIWVSNVHEAIAQYRCDFIQKLEDPAFVAKVYGLRGKVLGCYCKGKHLCHTAVIAGCANGDWILTKI